jgi:hypothetical protein
MFPLNHCTYIPALQIETRLVLLRTNCHTRAAKNDDGEEGPRLHLPSDQVFILLLSSHKLKLVLALSVTAVLVKLHLRPSIQVIATL